MDYELEKEIIKRKIVILNKEKTSFTKFLSIVCGSIFIFTAGMTFSISVALQPDIGLFETIVNFILLGFGFWIIKLVVKNFTFSEIKKSENELLKLKVMENEEK